MTLLWVWQAWRKGASAGCPLSSCKQQTLLKKKLGVTQGQVLGLQRAQAHFDPPATGALVPFCVDRQQGRWGGVCLLPSQTQECPSVGAPTSSTAVPRACLQPSPRVPGRSVP